MIPAVSQPAGLVQSSAERMHESFAYQQILAFQRGEVADPHACAAVEERIRSDRRWRAHWDSIRYLDLDRAAAMQDAADLARFTAAEATPFCKAAAETGGRIFQAILEGADERNRKEWNKHADRCVYCRRMRRQAHARQQRREAGLPAGELLLRDWLLSPCYLEALRVATRRLGFEWTPHEAASEVASLSTGNTILNHDTVLDAVLPTKPKAGHEPH